MVVGRETQTRAWHKHGTSPGNQVHTLSVVKEVVGTEIPVHNNPSCVSKRIDNYEYIF